ncbi:MAG: 5'-nucleotidase C-terminal domain-containing protein [Anaerolineae bacterium]|nr:5'-nucleotidase C-terminal domain-containing protein [Anaerolineae bacterium]NUQ03239.1 5'-nucleotidase C-terminal domain-containing protein [Anaerolineae bacterium]
MLRKLVLLGAFALLSALPALAQDDTFSLTILHTNDVHGHHEPQSSGDGGAGRQSAVVNQIRAEGGNVLLLDGGDRFTGTLYHQQYRGLDSARIMNAIAYDAMTLGNHEFDDGDDVLSAFIDAVEFPVVTANVDFSESAALAGKVDPYTVIEVNGQQIGVIGLVTPETPTSSSPSAALVFSADLVGVTQAMVDELTAAGVNKIILVTHIGLESDMAVAAGVTGLDVIVGGHSHSLLSNAYQASVAEYPVVVENPDGEPVYIVQAGQHDIHLGRLNVTFDAAGVVTAAAGDTILLSRYITPDPEIETIIEEMSGPIEELRATPIGATAEVFLVGDRIFCRVEECLLGNLIADAMRWETNVQIAITNGGGIRADIEEGEITLGEVLTVLPFGNLVATFELSGADVVAALENGVSRLTVENGAVVRAGASGRFPQVSGIRFSFDPTLEAGSRIVSVEVMGEGGEYAPIDPAAMYTVASNDFMRRGGDGYSVFTDNAVNVYDYGKPLDQVLAEYLADMVIVEPALEGRITVVNAVMPPVE